MAKKPLRLVEPTTADPSPMPAGLGQHGRALWAQVHAEYDVADVGGRAMLAQACAALDRAENCRVHIDHDGEIVKTKTGPREHPLLKAELANRAFAVRCLARLGLKLRADSHGDWPPAWVLTDADETPADPPRTSHPSDA